jgi:hypothetical protein
MLRAAQCGVATVSIEDIPGRGRCVHALAKDSVEKRIGIWNIPVEYAVDMPEAIQLLLRPAERRDFTAIPSLMPNNLNATNCP